jgi:hypothetical protein
MMQEINEEMGSRKKQRNKTEKAMKGKDLEANIEGKGIERYENIIMEVFKNIKSEDHKACTRLRLV